MPSLDVFATLFDTTPTTIMTTVSWEKVAITVLRWRLLSDHTLWLRMHFEDWDRLSEEVRRQGLERLLKKYGYLANDRNAWRRMSAYDWDKVPQPIRVMATVGMIEYWVNDYRVGEAFSLGSHDVLTTVKAIAMSESWFDHRALHVNRNGSVDMGIGGASGFARRTIRRWHRLGWCDFTLSNEDYYNPWLASRWLVFWFELMLQGANGRCEAGHSRVQLGHRESHGGSRCHVPEDRGAASPSVFSGPEPFAHVGKAELVPAAVRSDSRAPEAPSSSRSRVQSIEHPTSSVGESRDSRA